MYTFGKTDDGLNALHEPSQRMIAYITTSAATYNNDPRLKFPEKITTILPREKWLIHFTAYKFSPADLEVFVRELSTQQG